VRRPTRAGPSRVGLASRPTFSRPGVPYCPALGARQSLRWGYATGQCARALATTYPTATGTLRALHGEAIVASLVYTLAWVTRGAGALLRGSPSPLSAAADPFLVDTTPGAIGHQMASRLEGHGRWCRRPRHRRPAGAPLDPRMPGSPPQPLHPTVGAAVPTPPGALRRRGTPRQPGDTHRPRRGRVGPRARRGGRPPQAGGRRMSTRLIPRTVIITGDMPVTISRRRRTGVSGPCPWKGSGSFWTPPRP